jgi:SAM-dependent methyltransferase
MQTPKSEETSKFYDGLMDGSEVRGVFGRDRRFNPQRILSRHSTKKYFLEALRPYFSGQEVVLDLGCGPGAFLAALAPLCKEIIGADISSNFVATCQELIGQIGLSNARAIHVASHRLPFPEDQFDALLLVDVIHHLGDVDGTLREAFRVTKPGGRIFIFEPNKFNPLLSLMCIFDRNEWGFLKMGTPAFYRKLLSSRMEMERIEFNGLLIGPESALFDRMTDLMNRHLLKTLIGWLNPKIFITGRKL